MEYSNQDIESKILSSIFTGTYFTLLTMVVVSTVLLPVAWIIQLMSVI